MNNELDNTSTARIRPPKQISEPVYIDLRDLESIREIQQAQRRERVQEFNSRNW